MIVIYCSTPGLRFFIWYPRYCSAVRAPEGGVLKRETNVSLFFVVAQRVKQPTLGRTGGVAWCGCFVYVCPSPVYVEYTKFCMFCKLLYFL